MDDTRSIMSDTATLVERPETSAQILLLPGHSTRASKLSYDTSQGKYTMLEYLALTFSIMVTCNNHQGPFVVAIDEDLHTLNGDIQRAFPRWNNPLRASGSQPRIMELSVNWGQQVYGHKDFKDTKSILQKENIVAMMRLLKSRNGKDVIIAKTP